MTAATLLDDPVLLVGNLPEESFWRRFNKRFELPVSAATAVLLHMLAAGAILLAFSFLMPKEDRSAVAISLVPDLKGLDDDGDGSPGVVAESDPLHRTEQNALGQPPANLPLPVDLPKIKQDIGKSLKWDDGPISITEGNALAIAMLDKTLQQKLLGVGAKNGNGPAAGGGDGRQSAGPGGNGADSTRARSLRWVMRFRTASGADYLAQLRALKAVILVPIPPDNKRCHYFCDLNNLGERAVATDTELSLLSGLIRFTDTRAESVRAVCGELGVKDHATVFFAYFPKEMEAELSRKEIGYRNRRPEDVEETVFRVVWNDGGYRIQVDSQKPKR